MKMLRKSLVFVALISVVSGCDRQSYQNNILQSRDSKKYGYCACGYSGIENVPSEEREALEGNNEAVDTLVHYYVFVVRDYINQIYWERIGAENCDDKITFLYAQTLEAMIPVKNINPEILRGEIRAFFWAETIVKGQRQAFNPGLASQFINDITYPRFIFWNDIFRVQGQNYYLKDEAKKLELGHPEFLSENNGGLFTRVDDREKKLYFQDLNGIWRLNRPSLIAVQINALLGNAAAAVYLTKDKICKKEFSCYQFWLEIAAENGSQLAQYDFGQLLKSSRSSQDNLRGTYWIDRSRSPSSVIIDKYD